MRLTEALSWYNEKSSATKHLFHFEPTIEDIRLRNELKKVKNGNKKNIEIDIFEN